tara:strand:- start:85 stop:297 length:213 start_codon:yes stop_codon:yes gene_type:complete
MAVEVKVIDLPRGGQLEVECTKKFLDVVRQSKGFGSQYIVTDKDIREFIHSAFKIAIDKAESSGFQEVQE